jgi:hypothetical protein
MSEIHAYKRGMSVAGARMGDMYACDRCILVRDACL